MGLIATLLTLPVLGGPKLVLWLARTTGQAALDELLDEGQVRAAMMELYERYDAGAITTEEYDRQEETLLGRLNMLRELKARR